MKKIIIISEFSPPIVPTTSALWTTWSPWTSPSAAQVSCNFDYGLCYGWSQSSSDIFDWTRHRGSTSSSNTGPSSDHTTRNGRKNYAVNWNEFDFVEAWWKIAVNTKYILINTAIVISKYLLLLLLLDIGIANCQRAKILSPRSRCSICLEMSWIKVIYEKHAYSCRIWPLEMF